jgi:hypothetical protein
MRKIIWLCLGLTLVLWLSGCAGSSDLSPGEGNGVITTDDFDPFGGQQGPVHLRYFSVPSTGTYQIILSSGPDQPPLPYPWIRLLGGHVYETSESFFAAYNNGNGVLARNHGANIAQIIINATAGEEYTLVFSSYTAGTGAYSWRVVQL